MFERGKKSLRAAVTPLLRKKRDPFVKSRVPILHFAHHRVGTVWFGNVLSAVARAFFLRYYEHGPNRSIDLRADVFFFPHGGGPVRLEAFRASHMIRDPRDVVVSGYFYHLWTDEKWAHIPRDEWAGKTYQELLKSVDQSDGLIIEMRRFVEKDLQEMLAWDYALPEFIELRYEDVIADEAGLFSRMFQHYGFRPDAVERATQLAMGLSFERVSKRRLGEVQESSHLRSGRPGQWREVFSREHAALFKELAGPALIKLGYEADETW